MNVFIVIKQDDSREADEIAGVYDSLEKANARVKELVEEFDDGDLDEYVEDYNISDDSKPYFMDGYCNWIFIQEEKVQ